MDPLLKVARGYLEALPPGACKSYERITGAGSIRMTLDLAIQSHHAKDRSIMMKVVCVLTFMLITGISLAIGSRIHSFSPLVIPVAALVPLYFLYDYETKRYNRRRRDHRDQVGVLEDFVRAVDDTGVKPEFLTPEEIFNKLAEIKADDMKRIARLLTPPDKKKPHKLNGHRVPKHEEARFGSFEEVRQAAELFGIHPPLGEVVAEAKNRLWQRQSVAKLIPKKESGN